MQMSDAVEVVQVVGVKSANKHIDLGWKLMAVFPITDNKKVGVVYVLGRSEELPEVKPIEVKGML